MANRNGFLGKLLGNMFGRKGQEIEESQEKKDIQVQEPLAGNSDIVDKTPLELSMEDEKQVTYDLVDEQEDEKIESVEVYWERLYKNPFYLADVPEKVKLAEPGLCLLVIEQEPSCLQYVPENIEGYVGIASRAVEKDYTCLQYVPENVQMQPLAKPMFLKAISQNLAAIAYMGEKAQMSHTDIIWLVVQNNGLLLEYVPENVQKKSFSISTEAVKQNGCALKYVPESLRNRFICIDAVKNDPLALQYVPEEHRQACMEILGMIQQKEGQIVESQEAICQGDVKRSQLIETIGDKRETLHQQQAEIGEIEERLQEQHQTKVRDSKEMDH